MKVLSLFDGIGCGRLALERAGIEVDSYDAYEIDDNAIKIAKHHFPDIVQRGDVTTEDFTKYANRVDLLIGGSPCQNLSGMGNGKGLEGEQSRLFFDFVRAKNDCNPKYFLLENNASMTKKNKDIISKYMGCEPILINSLDFSAQSRKRLYWTNIPVKEWTPKHITLKDIAEPVCDKTDFIITDKVKKYSSSEYDGRKIQKNVLGKIRTLDETSKCLGCYCGDYGNNTGLIIQQDGEYYSITPLEAERLQNLPDNYTEGVTLKKRYHAIGNGWTVDVIAHIFSGLKE